MDRMAKLMGQGQDIAALAHIVEKHKGVMVRGHRMGIGPRGLARPWLSIDPWSIKNIPCPLGHGWRQPRKRIQYQSLGLIPAILPRPFLIERGIAVPMIKGLAAHRLGLEGIVAVRQTRIGLNHRRFERLNRFRINLIGKVTRMGG